MRVPIYEEIKLKDYDVMSFVDILRKSKVGKGPTYLELGHLEEKEAYLILETLSEALKILKISPLFPYPLYIIGPFNFPELNIPIIPNSSELPKHFYNRVKKLNSKELDLVNKITTLTERVSNHPLETRRRELKKSMKDQGTLFLLTRELASYENMLDALNRKSKED